VQAAILIAVSVLPAGVAFYGIPFGVMDGYVWPLYAKSEGLHKDYLKLKAENDKNEAFRQQKVLYENLIRQEQAQLETRRLLVPEEPGTDDFMRSVFDAGSSSRINVRTFIPQPQVTRDFYIEMPFKVRLDGTYYDLLSFFNTLAKETRIISVTDLSLGTPEGGGMGSYQVPPRETVGADCVITTYYSRPAPPPPAPPAKR
jgi:type IV pilus assembly protein PilO